MDWSYTLIGYLEHLLSQAFDFIFGNFFPVLVICGFIVIIYKLQHIINLLVLIAEIGNEQEEKLIDIKEKIALVWFEIKNR